MRIPNSVKVGGKTYRVLYPYTYTERESLQGTTDHGTNTIRLSAVTTTGEPRARENVEATFIHELLHVVDLIFNNDGLEEPVLTRLADGVYHALKDNGLLAEDPA